MSDVPSKSLQGSPEEAAADSSADPATQAFVEHRELLFSIVYNMLGTVADTEDVLQDTWLSWERRNQAPDAEPIDKPRAYLVRVAVNQALARQAAISRRRETYVGPWLPEPLATDDLDPADRAGMADSLNLAFLVLLESLSPTERAAFLLHDVFGYRHDEVAAMLERSPAAVRQLATRARAHLAERRPRYDSEPQRRQQAATAFMAAAAGSDLDGLMAVLAPDVTFVADGGGVVPATRHPLHGSDRVARAIVGLASNAPPDWYVEVRPINASPGIVIRHADGTPDAVWLLDVVNGRVATIHVVRNPAKLRAFAPDQACS